MSVSPCDVAVIEAIKSILSDVESELTFPLVTVIFESPKPLIFSEKLT
ncbi:MAG: hypothetical protein KAR57_02050 [Bacteroidales bacterium]|nr:hypothetical protein [Bacteroidales bacterium]